MCMCCFTQVLPDVTSSFLTTWFHFWLVFLLLCRLDLILFAWLDLLCLFVWFWYCFQLILCLLFSFCKSARYIHLHIPVFVVFWHYCLFSFAPLLYAHLFRTWHLWLPLNSSLWFPLIHHENPCRHIVFSMCAYITKWPITQQFVFLFVLFLLLSLPKGPCVPI